MWPQSILPNVLYTPALKGAVMPLVSILGIVWIPTIPVIITNTKQYPPLNPSTSLNRLPSHSDNHNQTV